MAQEGVGFNGGNSGNSPHARFTRSLFTTSGGGSAGAPPASIRKPGHADGSAFMTAPASNPAPAPVTNPGPVADVGAGDMGGFGGGGGGGGMAAAATQAATPPPMSLDDFIKSNFLYTAEQNEGQRRLDDFDAGTLRMQQQTEADQGMRRAALGRRLDDAGQSNAEDMAGRGLLRSGMTFQNQDQINESGIEQGNLIEQLLTNLLTDRGAGRIDQQAQNRSALNSRISSLTDQFNQKQLAPQGV